MLLMKQGILSAPGKIELRDIPVPEPSDGEIVVKIDTALTCGTDLKAFVRGHTLIPMPGPFGHEYAGVVAKTGKDAGDYKEGDPVMGVHSAPCMRCRYCKKGLYNLCDIIMEKKALGAFAEYLLLPSGVVTHNLFRKPEDLSFVQAALLEPLSCVVHPYNKGNIKDTETALVTGSGPIGLMHLAYLKKKGAKVIVSDISGERLSIAREMGADYIAGTGAGPDSAIEQEVSDATDGLGVDLAVECTGQKSVWEKTVNYIRKGGTVILFGGCPAGTGVCYDSRRLHYDELTLIGSFHYTPRDVQTAFRMLAEKKIDLSRLISGEFPLQDLEKAFMLLREGKGIKYALRP